MNKRSLNDDTESSDSDSEQTSDITVATQFNKTKNHLNMDVSMYPKKTETCV